MKNARKYIVLALTMLMITAAFTPAALADSLSTYYNTIVSEAGWQLRSDKYHMGSKSFSYQNSTGVVNKGYPSKIADAIQLWNGGATGNSRRMKLNYTSSTDQGHFTTTADSVFYKITRYNTSNSEVTGWSISLGETLYSYYSVGSSSTNALTTRVIAQSLGYVYGLNKVSYDCVMNNNDVWSIVRTCDCKGLSVVTHAHKHMSNFTGSTVLEYSSINHRCRCSDCKAFYLQQHTLTGPHAGIYTCSVCGYTTTDRKSVV